MYELTQQKLWNGYTDNGRKMVLRYLGENPRERFLLNRPHGTTAPNLNPDLKSEFLDGTICRFFVCVGRSGGYALDGRPSQPTIQIMDSLTGNMVLSWKPTTSKRDDFLFSYATVDAIAEARKTAERYGIDFQHPDGELEEFLPHLQRTVEVAIRETMGA